MNMKRAFTVAVAAILLAAQIFYAFPAQAGFGNFSYSWEYADGQFRDVRGADWFARHVEDAYNFGFFSGKGDGAFDPGGTLTLGEAVTLAARIRSIYDSGSAVFPESVPYYSVYADYAISHGIIDSHGDYGAPVTRERFAALMYNTLPQEAFPVINAVPDFGICDVASDSAAGAAVYALYRAGILAGSDRYGTFFAGSNISRAEACAVTVRMVDPASRVRLLLPAHIPAEVIFKRSVEAVFLLETFDDNGDSIRTGSGFFISASGLAVTNLHVIENAAGATITLYNGDVYHVRGVYAFSMEDNLALLAVEAGKGGWSFLTLADSNLIAAGNTVYALGSPRALINTISEGIISYSRREVNWDMLIQFTAPISFGSGGSPLLNALGQVVGVASSTYTSGQNLNLAVPVNLVKELEPGRLLTLKEFSER